MYGEKNLLLTLNRGLSEGLISTGKRVYYDLKTGVIGEGLICIYIEREEFTVDCKQGSLVRGYLNGKRIYF